MDYTADNVHPDMSFLEMLDVVNESLIKRGEDPIAFDSDCREGICGSCGLVIDGIPHGPDKGATTCQVHMRRFRSGETITIEPFRAKGFPIIKDLVVDRAAFDRIIAAGGYVSMNVGGAPDANSLPIAKKWPIRRWIPRSASAAAPAWRPAKTQRRTSSPQPRSRISDCCRRAKPSAAVVSSGWSGRWTPKASAAARTKGDAKRCARRKSRFPILRG